MYMLGWVGISVGFDHELGSGVDDRNLGITEKFKGLLKLVILDLLLCECMDKK